MGRGKYLGSEEVRAIRLVLNENERLAIGIQFGILDIEFVKRHSRQRVLRDWKLGAPFVTALQLRTGKDGFYHEFKDLADKLETNRLPRRSYWWKLWF